VRKGERSGHGVLSERDFGNPTILHPSLKLNLIMSSSPVKCAPANNLNKGFPHFPTAHELYAHLRSITQSGGEFVVRNFVAVVEDISPDASLVCVFVVVLHNAHFYLIVNSHQRLSLHSETELFPKGALMYYTKKNMGWEYTKEESEMWQLAERGGAQGDYRDGVRLFD
jgi:hypothetical protein